jgi:uncharacterized membrane protein
VIIELLNFYIRYRNATATVSSTAIFLSFLVVCILLFTGWKGWELVYRHRVGVAERIEESPVHVHGRDERPRVS